MEKKLQRVTFKQAENLWALGFNYEMKEYYQGWDKKLVSSESENHNSSLNCFSAPEISLAIKWLRDEKKIWVFVFYDYDNTAREYPNLAFKWQMAKSFGVDTTNAIYHSYEKAESAGLDYALDYLLKEKK